MDLPELRLHPHFTQKFASSSCRQPHSLQNWCLTGSTLFFFRCEGCPPSDLTATVSLSPSDLVCRTFITISDVHSSLGRLRLWDLRIVQILSSLLSLSPISGRSVGFSKRPGGVFLKQKQTKKTGPGEINRWENVTYNVLFGTCNEYRYHCNSRHMFSLYYTTVVQSLCTILIIIQYEFQFFNSEKSE